jgi:2-aminoethylphosphonate-pyruvate transaminase
MSLYARDPILLTPGPLTTSLPTKAAMLRDWGSWDAAFNAVTADVRRKLLAIIHGQASHVCVPMQGSGTFSVEAAVNTLVPRDGHVLVLINGAYGGWRAVAMMGRPVTFETAEDADHPGRRSAAHCRSVDYPRGPDPLRRRSDPERCRRSPHVATAAA